jgi:hypothetical protein
MAKGKHSTALFEVIHSGKKPDRVAQSLRTPKWWFKSRHQSKVTSPPPVPSFEAEPQYVEEDRQEPVEEAPVTRMRPSRSDRSSGIRFGFNRNNQEFTFQLRYTTALVTAFGVCVLVGLSYVVGRHLGGGPKVASAEPSVKELMQQPAQPDVTRVTKPRVSQNSTPSQRSSTPTVTTDRSGSSAPLANNAVPQRQRMASSFVPASADTSSPRKPGLNYLVIQIYPDDRRSSAEAAKEFFTKNGIPCTIEKTGWTMGKWLTLIGTAGFNKVSGEDFKTYVEHAAAIAKTYKTANFDRPEPTTASAYKWRATDGQN